MEVETIRMSSKGQIVIPQDIREELKTTEGTIFAVYGHNDTIILKKITTPSKEDLISELGAIAKAGRIKLEKQGITEKDISKIIGARRKWKLC